MENYRLLDVLLENTSRIIENFQSSSCIITGFTQSVVLGNLTRADALVDSFPSTIDNS
jgi:mannose/fructose/N-acetylgalactosamine-specific phosphotransferase system component IIC